MQLQLLSTVYTSGRMGQGYIDDGIREFWGFFSGSLLETCGLLQGCFEVLVIEDFCRASGRHVSERGLNAGRADSSHMRTCGADAWLRCIGGDRQLYNRGRDL